MHVDDAVMDWLLEGDPAIRWQVQRDLQGVPASAWAKTQDLISDEGWGARLLALQASDGSWGGGLYGPKWTSTFYTLRLLYWLGLDGTPPAAVNNLSMILDFGFLDDGGINLWDVDVTDTCVNAMTLSLALHFGHCWDDRVDVIASGLLEEQIDDDGWNCRAFRSGCDKSSFHSTLSALEALEDYAATSDDRRARVQPALDKGHAYFLRHHLFLSERTGELVDEKFSRFSFPVRWKFDLLRALDHFRAARVPLDPRLDAGLALVRKRRNPDGRWTNQNRHAGKQHFVIERAGAPSRWNTLRALRVLAWSEQS